MPGCSCCYEESTFLQYRTSDSDEWIHSIYCIDCGLTIRDSRWRSIKGSILKIDCLAAFNRIIESRIPLVLTVNDLKGVKDTKVVSEIRYQKPDQHEYTVESGDINAEITEEERDRLLRDLQELKDQGDILQDAVLAVCQKYFEA